MVRCTDYRTLIHPEDQQRLVVFGWPISVLLARVPYPDQQLLERLAVLTAFHGRDNAL